MLDAHALRIFLTVADEGAIGRAADVLDYTPSNVTQHVRALERQVGHQLVERHGRGIRLTGKGEALARLARPVLAGLQQLPTALGGRAVGGTVTVAAVPTVVRGLLVPVIQRLRARAPEVHLVPRELEASRTIVELRSGRVDLALTKYWSGVARPELPAHLSQTPVLDERIDLLLPAGHPLAGQPSVSVRDVFDDVWAITPPEDPFRDWLEATLPWSSYQPRRRLEAVEEQTLLEFVRAGLAVAALPRLGRGELPAGVVAKPLADARAQRSIVLLSHRAGLPGSEPDGLQLVREIVAEVAAELEPSLLA